MDSVMPRYNRGMEGLIPGRIRKRGCSSPASSSSSMIQSYRLKRAIVVGKRDGSTTPVPNWRLMNTRSPAGVLRNMESPKYQTAEAGGDEKRQAPVSARKLAATLWEMNVLPSPRLKEELEKRRLKREVRAREKTGRSVHSGSLPPHLSDPSHSPVSERINRSGTGSRHRRASSITHRLRLADNNVGALESYSNASLMEVETRSRVQTPTGSTVGGKSRLKDVSNALITSKELLKIINRMWGHDRPSSSMSLISALHAELERARLQVNQFIQEQCMDQNEINYLLKCFAEERASWKIKEKEVVEAAIKSIAGELDVERKLRRRFESLNKKLGRELAEAKTSLLKVVSELESEKRARDIMEQICDKFVGDIDVDKVDTEEVKRESAKVREEVEKEREMMQLANALHEERVQMKLSDAKYQLEEKNAAVDKLRNQLAAFLESKIVKEKGHRPLNQTNNEEYADYLNRTRFGSHQNEEDDVGEVEDEAECLEDSAESDLHSIELNMDNSKKSYMWTNASGVGLDSRRAQIEEAAKGRKSTFGKESRRSISLQRSMSDGVEWNIQSESLQNSGEGLEWSRSSEQAQERGYVDEKISYKLKKGPRDQILSGSRVGSSRIFSSPTRQWGPPWPARDSSNVAQERPPLVPGKGLKSRLADTRGEGQNVRKCKR